MRDLLEWYNNLDVVPKLKACLKQKEFFCTFSLDMYKDAYSMPSLSENIMFQFLIKGFEEFLKIPFPETEKIPTIYNSNITSKIVEYRLQDKAANRNVDNLVILEQVWKLLENYNYSCYYCWDIISYHDWNLDRIYCSIAQTNKNCTIACIECNRQRRDQF